MVAPHAQIDRFLRQPEKRQDFVPAVFIIRVGRKDQHKGGDVGGTGQIQPAVAGAPTQGLGIDREGAGVPLVHWHPAHGGVRPLAEMELPELHFLRRVLLGAFAGGAVVFHVHGLAQRGVDRFPDPGVCPVGLRRRGIDHGVERRVMLAPFEDVHRLGMDFITNRVLVAARRCNDEIERLLACRAGALGHNVEQFAVGLAEQFVEDAGVDVVAVLRGHLRGKRLIDAPGRQVYEALLALHDLDAL